MIKLVLKWSQMGTVDSAVASDSRGPGSKPVIDKFYWTYLLSTVWSKDENKEKEAGIGPFFLKKITHIKEGWRGLKRGTSGVALKLSIHNIILLKKFIGVTQCDQIGRFNGLWADF